MEGIVCTGLMPAAVPATPLTPPAPSPWAPSPGRGSARVERAGAPFATPLRRPWRASWPARPRGGDGHWQERPWAARSRATLASTGTPALFVHPAEASHGDLGMVTLDRHRAGPVQLGRERGAQRLAARAQAVLGAPLFAMTGRATSTLAARRPGARLRRGRSLPAAARAHRQHCRAWRWRCAGRGLAGCAAFKAEDFALPPWRRFGRKLLSKVAT